MSLRSSIDKVVRALYTKLAGEIMLKKDLIKRHNDNLDKLFDLFSKKVYDIDEENLEDEAVYDLDGIGAHKMTLTNII